MEKSEFKIGQEVFVIITILNDNSSAGLDFLIIKNPILLISYYNENEYSPAPSYYIDISCILYTLWIDSFDEEKIKDINQICGGIEMHDLLITGDLNRVNTTFSYRNDKITASMMSDSIFKTQEEAEEALEKYLNKNHPSE